MSKLADWLDIRPQETRRVIQATLGAFLIMAFLVLGRALRESLYLTTFAVETLPYITAAVALSTLPAVALFTRRLSHSSPRRVLAAVTLMVVAGLIVLWPFAGRNRVGVVLFYLWTALGTILLTSGFWGVTAEAFAVRGAKRLFGVIGAGGTAGAMLVGGSLSWLTGWLALPWLIALLIVLLLLFHLNQLLSPRSRMDRLGPDARGTGEAAGLRVSLGLVWRSPYLRAVAGMVFLAAVVGILLDYQFKELARAGNDTQPELASFLGAFYGWTGGVALLLQLLVASRFIATAGVAWGMAVMPLAVMLGSILFLLVPGLPSITLVRGADVASRRSIGRTVLEYLFVPLPADLRRKTKTFIDSVVDSLAEGGGAALLFLWVTLARLPSRYLSLYVIGFSLLFLLLARRMGRLYFRNIVSRLQEGGEGSADLPAGAYPHQKDLLSGAFTRLDMETMTVLAALPGLGEGEAAESGGDHSAESPDELRMMESLAQLQSPEQGQVLQALRRVKNWDEAHIAQLIWLLARDGLYRPVVQTLRDIGHAAVQQLALILQDDNADFVIRRRIPAALAAAADAEADDALLDALAANRFEVRYQAAIALVHRRRRERPVSQRQWRDLVWQAIRAEVARDRPVWELQKLLDGFDRPDDDLVAQQVGVRGAASLEHTFRMMTLVLDPEPVRAAFHGIMLSDEHLKSYALEYLEQALPTDIRRRLWLIIGDVSESKRQKALRSLDEVASDLMATRATLFAGEQEREALRRMLEKREE